MHTSVFLGLGSNLGDRPAALEEARRRLEDRGYRTTQRSSTWQTEPVGGPPQGWFLNAVLAGETSLEPEELLQACLDTERAMGRVRAEKNGPRLIDVDILLFGDTRREGPGLVIPHPRLHQRLFVLAPLHEIAPALRHPVLGLTVSELKERCPDTSAVRPWTPVEAAV
ncbi:MAG: 2-amino-4-hydroxy-6-hydroxymethyldihydropteridine diphosphokinase [Acidobacteria bacterium]|jgi:2-amino-4-hydroxy-6-hydroxymethyldihydropteridine diphosphokinase|nr:2-amino-4-hydroxy-6-hydroxymethyldihydropteridine diphosphokinase [Acidobacteriota bacterium]